MDTSDLCVCIPVRFQSTRLPRKALIKLAGLTVIERTIEQILKSSYLTKEQIYVFTDDERIASVVKVHGIQVIMTSSNCANALVRLSRYIDMIPEKYKYIINLHGDEPMLNIKNVDYLIEKWHKYKSRRKQKYWGLQLIRKLNHDEAVKLCQVKAVMDNKFRLLYCSRAWLPHTKNGQITNYKSVQYYGIVGLHLINRRSLRKYDIDKKAILYQIEDVEELKLLEMGVDMKCIIAPHRQERSLNTPEDLSYFLTKFGITV